MKMATLRQNKTEHQVNSLRGTLDSLSASSNPQQAHTQYMMQEI